MRRCEPTSERVPSSDGVNDGHRERRDVLNAIRIVDEAAVRTKGHDHRPDAKGTQLLGRHGRAHEGVARLVAKEQARLRLVRRKYVNVCQQPRVDLPRRGRIHDEEPLRAGSYLDRSRDRIGGSPELNDHDVGLADASRLRPYVVRCQGIRRARVSADRIEAPWQQVCEADMRGYPFDTPQSRGVHALRDQRPMCHVAEHVIAHGCHQRTRDAKARRCGGHVRALAPRSDIEAVPHQRLTEHRQPREPHGDAHRDRTDDHDRWDCRQGSPT